MTQATERSELATHGGVAPASRISLGSWHTFSRLSQRDIDRLVSHSLDLGVNFFDTAYYPDAPDTETKMGHAVAGLGVRRDEVFLSEKVWYHWYPHESLADQLSRSLDRLGVDYVDLLYCGVPTSDVDLADVVEQMLGIVASGRACSWGLLNWRPADLLSLCTRLTGQGSTLPAAAQLKYSVARSSQVSTREMQRCCEEFGLRVHASDSLEGGLLAGRTTLDRPIAKDPGGIRSDIVDVVVPHLRALADARGVPMATLSLAYCLTNPMVASVLVGATRIEQMDQNVAAIAAAKAMSRELYDELSALSVSGHTWDQPFRLYL